MTVSWVAITAARLASIAASQSAMKSSGASATPSRDSNSYTTTFPTPSTSIGSRLPTRTDHAARTHRCSGHGHSYTGAMARSTTSEAVVLRSFRLGEADRILHVYTQDRGRVGAVAKGVRKTKSRFGARLEPLSHVELVLHEGSGELHTVTGVHLRNSHHEIREDTYRLGI